MYISDHAMLEIRSFLLRAAFHAYQRPGVLSCEDPRAAFL